MLNIFYDDNAVYTAKIQRNGITFGTVFADTFCKQPHSNIQTKVMKKGLITSILALTFSGLQAQPLPASPKLVVTLTIAQLRTIWKHFRPYTEKRGLSAYCVKVKYSVKQNFLFAERTEPRPLPPSIPGQHRP